MNSRQKLYDSNNSGNALIKITNSSVLSQNLEKIRNRKPIYKNSLMIQKKKSKSILVDYEIKKDNSVVKKIINQIRAREVKPILYTQQNEIVNNSMKSKKKHHLLSNLEIEKENQSLRKRIFNLKPFISAKSLDKQYNNMIIKNKAKKNANKSLVLPPINNHKY